MSAPRKLFVYGTLMRGEPNHPLLGVCAFLGPARTAPGFALVDLGSYPAMIADGGGRVDGELYAVDERTLATLDDLEDHPRLYRRRPIELADGTQAEAYVMPTGTAAGLPTVASGDWRRR